MLDLTLIALGMETGENEKGKQLKIALSLFSSMQHGKAVGSPSPISVCFSLLLFFIARNKNFNDFIHLLSDAQSSSGNTAVSRKC